MLVFDLTDMSSFRTLKMWKQTLKSVSVELKSVRVHFAPGSNGRSFPLEYS